MHIFLSTYVVFKVPRLFFLYICLCILLVHFSGEPWIILILAQSGIKSLNSKFDLSKLKKGYFLHFHLPYPSKIHTHTTKICSHPELCFTLYLTKKYCAELHYKYFSYGATLISLSNNSFHHLQLIHVFNCKYPSLGSCVQGSLDSD